MNKQVRYARVTRTIAAAAAMVLILTGCTGSNDTGNQAVGEASSTTLSDQGQATSSTTTPSGASSDDGSSTTTTPPDQQADDDSDQTLPPPDSLVPGTEFCEPTRTTGQAIRFQPGAEEAILRSPSEPGQSDLYSVQVRADQTMTVIITSPNLDVVGTLLPPDGIFIPGTFTSTTVTETVTGTYWVCVVSGNDSDRYELTVSVIDNKPGDSSGTNDGSADNTPTKIVAEWCGSSVNDRGEIKFAAGASSGQVDEAVILGERDRYILEAGQGQRFSGEINAFEDNAAFQLRSPSGEIILDAEAAFSLDLPESGIYELCIGSTRGNATYTLDLIIE